VHAGWRVLRSSDRDRDTGRNLEATRAWLDQKEAEHGHLILLCTDPKDCAAWHQATANNCDTIVLVHDRRGAFSTEDAPSALERDIFSTTLPPNIHYVLTRPETEVPTQGTAAFLKDRPVGLHHHVALDAPGDFARLARFLAGEAIGLVLCGGGSYGTAHLGVIKALQERGHAFDFVGGTSVGSAMAGALSMGLKPDDIMEQCEDIFLRSKAMSRLTVPRYSLLDHHTLDAAFKKHYGAYDVEDLPINFVAISPRLTCNAVSIIRKGPGGQAIRASTAIPGIFPPFLREDGEVLIDGGLIDNVPLDAMRDLKPGPNVVLNFMPGKPWTVRAKYDDLPTRIEALGGLFRRAQKGVPRHPTAFTVLARAMVVNARKLLATIDVGSDVLLNIAVLPGMSFMNWKRGRELFESAYGQMSVALNQTNTSGMDRLDQLRDAACLVNAATDELVGQPRRETSTEPTE
ncbi:MAG: patatin-like phospholipase family protein, partial [Ruegeria sp.]